MRTHHGWAKLLHLVRNGFIASTKVGNINLVAKIKGCLNQGKWRPIESESDLEREIRLAEYWHSLTCVLPFSCSSLSSQFFEIIIVYHKEYSFLYVSANIAIYNFSRSLHVIVKKPEACITTLGRRPKTPPVDGNHDQNEWQGLSSSQRLICGLSTASRGSSKAAQPEAGVVLWQPRGLQHVQQGLIFSGYLKKFSEWHECGFWRKSRNENDLDKLDFDWQKTARNWETWREKRSGWG